MERIDVLYELLDEMTKAGRSNEAAALRWAIFTLESMTGVKVQ